MEDEAENDDDIEAGPALPPDEVEDGIGDEDGRFFGGGITSGTAEALDYIDEQDEGDGMVRTSVHPRTLAPADRWPQDSGEDRCIVAAESRPQLRKEDIKK